MSATAIGRRLVALGNSTPVINSLADYALWRAHSRNPNVKWDQIFKKQLEEAFSK